MGGSIGKKYRVGSSDDLDAKANADAFRPRRQSNSLAPTVGEHQGGTGHVIGSTNGASGFLLAAVDFAECAASSPVQAVQKLVARAAVECGGDVFFYSAPDGRGRRALGLVVPRGKDAHKPFQVVCSSNVVAKPGKVATQEHARVMQMAMYSGRGMAEQGDVSAACVRTILGLEGLLLVERPPRIRALVSQHVLIGLHLWALFLAERLERLAWEQEASDGRRSLLNLLRSMRHSLRHDLHEAELHAAEAVSPGWLQQHVKAEHTTIWFWDEPNNEMVLNNSGRMDGTRIPVGNSRLSMEAMEHKRCVESRESDNVALADKSLNARRLDRSKVEREHVICIPVEEPPRRSTVRASRSGATSFGTSFKGGKPLLQPSHTIPGFDIRAATSMTLESQEPLEPPMVGLRSEDTFHGAMSDCSDNKIINTRPRGQCLIQFVKYGRDGAASVQDQQEYFDSAAAETLQRTTSLAKAIWTRHHMMKHLAAEREEQSMQAVTASLARATKATDIITALEELLPTALQCETCSMWFIDNERREVWAPPTQLVPGGMRLKIGEGLVGNVAVTARASGSEEVQVVNDPASSSVWKGDRPGTKFVTRNIMTAPIWSGHGHQRQLVGLIQVLNRHALVGFYGSAVFGQADADLLQSLCSVVGSHLQRLLLDIQWTKSCMDMDQDVLDSSEDQELVTEYYTKEFAKHFQYAMRMATGDDDDDDKQNPGDASPAFKTVHNLLEIPTKSVEMSVHVDPHRYEEVMLNILFETPSDAGMDVHSWLIHYFVLSEEDEFRLFVHALQHFDVLSELKVERSHLYRYFMAVKSTYQNVPFHNFHHAVATVHYVFKLLEASGGDQYLTKTDLFALLVGALVHDCDHRGRNNAFEVVTRGELAVRYNDASPLENHHCAQAFELALNGSEPRSGECNIFQNFTSDQYHGVRKRMIAGILSTDMKCHGNHVELMQNFQPSPGVNNSQCQFLVELFLHTADISNPLMPEEVSTLWAKRIAEEFTDQVKDEEVLEVPVTAFMQGLHSPAAFAKSQLGFIDFVILPLVGPMFRVFPGLSPLKANLDENREHYVHMKESEARGSLSDGGSIYKG